MNSRFWLEKWLLCGPSRRKQTGKKPRLIVSMYVSLWLCYTHCQWSRENAFPQLEPVWACLYSVLPILWQKRIWSEQAQHHCYVFQHCNQLKYQSTCLQSICSNLICSFYDLIMWCVFSNPSLTTSSNASSVRILPPLETHKKCLHVQNR